MSDKMEMQDRGWVDYYTQQNSTLIERTDNELDGSSVLTSIAAPNLNYSLYDNETSFPGYSNFTTDDYCSSNHSHVYLNVTCEFPINYAEPMYG